MPPLWRTCAHHQSFSCMTVRALMPCNAGKRTFRGVCSGIKLDWQALPGTPPSCLDGLLLRSNDHTPTDV